MKISRHLFCLLQINGQCENIDECRSEVYPCNLNAWCYDTAGSYYCQCIPGYEGNGVNCSGESCLLLLHSSNWSYLLCSCILVYKFCLLSKYLVKKRILFKFEIIHTSLFVSTVSR